MMRSVLGFIFVLLAVLLVASVISPAFGDRPTIVVSAESLGYAVTNDDGIPFADEYKRLGGIDILGLPASDRFQFPDGFVYQATQGALLQWQTQQQRVVFANTFDLLQQAGHDEWLYTTKSIPRPIGDDGSGGDWPKAKATRLGWLTNEAIKARYLANPSPNTITTWSEDASIELYGLPTSLPERFGPFVVQRFQRIAFQLWLDDVPDMPRPGSVVRVLGGDLLKQAGLVPMSALATNVKPTPAPTPNPKVIPTAMPKPTTNLQIGCKTPTTIEHSPIVQPGTYVGRWDSLEELVYLGVGPREFTGPGVNMRFTPEMFGKMLTVRVDQLAYDKLPNTGGGCPGVYLYQSLVGQLKKHQAYNIPPYSNCVDLLTVPGQYFESEPCGTKKWQIPSGDDDYFLFFGLTGDWRGPNYLYPELPINHTTVVTYTVTIE